MKFNLCISAAQVVRGEFGPGSGPIFLNRLDCDGTESSLFDCSGFRTTVNLCAHTEDVAISCEGKNTGSSESHLGSHHLFHVRTSIAGP